MHLRAVTNCCKENLEICPNIAVLYLYDNKITVIERLEPFASTLTSLYLQNNLISDLKPLAPLRNLVKLYSAKCTATHSGQVFKRKSHISCRRFTKYEETRRIIHI